MFPNPLSSFGFLKLKAYGKCHEQAFNGFSASLAPSNAIL
jgi:hypothetical protein